jgi:hypothetical protein
MLRRVALVRTDVSEELSPSFIKVTRIGELGTTLAVTGNQRTLRRNTRVAFSPQANYTDGATATCWGNLVPPFADIVVSRGQRSGSPTAVNLSFLDRSRYFSFK